MSFFAPSYFGGTLPGVGLIEADQPLSDALALCWIRDTLTDSELFKWVGMGRTVRGLTSGDYPAAWIYPVSFSETDEVDPYQPQRELTYAVAVVIKPDDPTDDFEVIKDLDRLSNAVANLLSSDGPEGYIPGLSRIKQGRYDTIPIGASAPAIGTATAAITLIGCLSYFVEGRCGRDQGEQF